MAFDGYLNFDTKIDATGFNKGTRSISNSLGGLKSQLTKVGTAIGVAFGVTKLVQFGKQAIDTASDVAEVQNVVDTAFGSLSKRMDDFADTAVETYGISKLTAKQTGSTYMAMASGMGLAQENASDMALALTGLSADMASFYNVEQDVVSTALKSIFTGETETLKQFGIVMTDANLQAFALSKGINKKTSAMSQAEKVQLRYNYVMSQTALAQGDFAKTSDSWANQTRIVTEKWKEFSSTIGEVLLNIFLPTVKAVNRALTVLIDLSKKAVSALSSAFGWDTSATQQTEKHTSNIADNINDSVTAQNNLTKAVKKTNKEIDKGLASYDELNVMQDNITADTSGGNTVDVANNARTQAGKQVADKTSKGITDGLSKALKNLYKNSGLEKFVSKIQKGIDSVNWSNIGDNFKSIFNSLQPIAKATLKGVQKVGKSAFGALGSYIGGWISVSGKQFETLSGGIAEWLNKDKSRIMKYIDNVSDNFATGFDNISKLYDSVFGSMGKSIDKMRPKVKKAIANLLGGFTTFGISIGTVVSDAFRISTDVIADWAVENEATITEMFDNIQLMFCDVANLVGEIFGDIGTIISDWWNGDDGGSSIFENVCEMFTNIGTTMMNVFNDWIKPAWDFIVGVAKSAWEKCLKPIFNSVLKFFGKLCDAISTVWNSFLSPVVNWLIKTLKPVFVNVFNAVKGVFDTVFETVGGVISGILDALGGLLDFITGIFSLDFKKAWKGIKSFFKGIWDGIWSIVKGAINLIIDGLNLLWSGIYTVISGIVNNIGGIAGFIGDIFGCDWEFSMPDEPPLIPKLATGTVVPASYGEFMAILGDNKREPEVVSPLSTIKQAVKEAFEEGGFGTGNGEINLTINLDGEAVYKSVVKHDKANVKRRGTSAFAY